MTNPVGGQRLSLINYNMHKLIKDCLHDLGWLNTGRQHKPITVIDEPFDPSVEIQPNVVSISGEELLGIEVELGSDLEENRWSYYVDIYPENIPLGRFIAGDIRDILRGKMNSIGRNRPNLGIVNPYSGATPSVMFYVEFEDVDIQRVRKWQNPYNKDWFTVSFVLVDYYDSDLDLTLDDDDDDDDIDGGGPDDSGDDVDGGGPDDSGDDFDGGTP